MGKNHNTIVWEILVQADGIKTHQNPFNKMCAQCVPFLIPIQAFQSTCWKH